MDTINDLTGYKKKILSAAGIFSYFVSAAMLVYSVFLSMSTDIWYDELFSMEFACRDISEMIQLTAADVHPPLYYIVIHFFVFIFEKINIDAVVAAKLASVVPFIILYIYGITSVRKRFGIFTGGIFSLAVLGMPNISEYLVEIRMYSIAIFFITALCIHSLPFLEEDKDKQIRGLKWGKAAPLFIYGLLACYIQYYAAVAVFAVYLFLVVWSVRKNIMQLGILLISGNLTVICYYPWIGKVLSQVGTVSENYWIQELTIRSLGGVVKYLMKPSFFNDKLSIVLAVLMTLLVFAVVILNIRNAKVWLMFMPITGIVAFGFAASMLIRPIFIYRYMLPGMGAFWLGIIIGCRKILDNDIKRSGILWRIMRAIPYAAALFMIIFSIRDYWAFRGNELYRKVNMVETKKLFAEISDKEDAPVIICNFDHVCGLMAYYLDEKEGRDDMPVLLYGMEPEKLIMDMLPKAGHIENAQDIKNILSSGKKVLFMGSFNSREDLLKEWENEAGIKSENKGSYLLERYWFDVFELSL